MDKHHLTTQLLLTYENKCKDKIPENVIQVKVIHTGNKIYKKQKNLKDLIGTKYLQQKFKRKKPTTTCLIKNVMFSFENTTL